jgi:hypothetical protein
LTEKIQGLRMEEIVISKKKKLTPKHESSRTLKHGNTL